MNNRTSVRPVLAALTIILLGLFMLCSQKQMVVTPGEDLSEDDAAFREELLAMLDMDEGDAAVDTSSGDAAETSSDDADLFTLLAGLEEAESDADFVEENQAEVFETAPDVSQPTAAEPTLQPDQSNLLSEVRRLEGILERRSVQVDSLRRIIDNRSVRIAELQTEIARKKSGAPAPMIASKAQPQPAARSKSPQNYQPLIGFSGPFVEKYNAARLKFESYDYQGCIDAMSELLASEPNHVLADNAQYWIGESYYGLKQYQKAIVEFQKVFAYEAADKYDDAQLMIGLSYVRLGQPQLARTSFNEFLGTYAGSEYAHIAKRYYETI